MTSCSYLFSGQDKFQVGTRPKLGLSFGRVTVYHYNLCPTIQQSLNS
jgi:hypothetical protein